MAAAEVFFWLGGFLAGFGLFIIKKGVNALNFLCIGLFIVEHFLDEPNSLLFGSFTT
ncbi:MAG: hypothetical protein ABS873_03755 [Alkalibacterium sp.]